MKRMNTILRRYFEGWATVDPAVALGLFGTGVGLVIPELPITEHSRPAAQAA